MVDKNYVEGTVQDAAGKVEEGIGYAAGSPGARIEGKVRQAAGKAQAAYGRTAEEISAQIRDATQRRPFFALLMAGLVGMVLGRMTVRR
jgi:uncharacterized protein YjbJ (UPF0337 family)